MQTHIGMNTKTTQKIVYQIMHKDRLTAEVSSLGEAVIHDEQFMPYDLYLSDENNDFDMRINNINVSGINDKGVIELSSRRYQEGNDGAPVLLNKNGKWVVIGILSHTDSSDRDVVVPISYTK